MLTSDEIINDLRSPDFVRQVKALDRFFAVPADAVPNSVRRQVLDAAILAFETSSNPRLMAERLLRFGQEIDNPLGELLNRTTSQEMRVLAALVLLNKGQRRGVPILMQEIKRGGEYQVIASVALANAGVSDHADVIVQQLQQYQIPVGREFPTADDERMISFLDVLDRIHVDLPSDVRRKLTASTAPRFLRDAVHPWREGRGA